MMIFLVGVATIAWWVSDRCCQAMEPFEPPSWLDRWVMMGICVFLVAIGLNWGLALIHLLTPTGLVCASSAGAILVGLQATYRRFCCNASTTFAAAKGAHSWLASLGLSTWVLYLAIGPVLLWIVYILWRGWVIPVCSHDALAYHMPKAVLMAKAHGFGYFLANDVRISASPANYELLLADFLILAHTDACTTWISSLCYMIMVGQAMAMVQRWWGPGVRVLAMGLLVAGMPVALLQSGAHKNDLMMAMFILGAVHWGTSWAFERSRATLILTLSCWFAAFGTKGSALFFLPTLGLPLCVIFWKRKDYGTIFRTGERSAILATVFLGFLLLGGVVYVVNLWQGNPWVGYQAKQILSSSKVNYAPYYGQWPNLWIFPALAFLVPFSARTDAVWVPWRGEYWFWPKFEFYFSHFGMLVSLLLFLVPVALYLTRKWRKGSRHRRHELTLASWSMVISSLFLLPVGFRTLGFCGGFARYLIFLPILIACWSLVPLVSWVESGSYSKGLLQNGIILGLALVFTFQALEACRLDRFAPLEYAARIAMNPGERTPNFQPFRAGVVVDKIAGSKDTIAFDGGITDAWIYPAYGSGLHREVRILLDGQDIHSKVKGADWVVVDRMWNITWENPALIDMGQFFQFIDKGAPTPEDLATFRSLIHDPEWQLIYFIKSKNQAIFRRVK